MRSAIAFMFAGAFAFAVPAFPETGGSGSSGQSATTGSTATARHGGAGYTQQGDEGQGGLQHFIVQAALSNMAEIQLGQLAQQKGQDPRVKQFAQTMIDQHSKAESQLQKIASTSGITLPSSLDIKHQQIEDKLSKLSASEFDREYMKVMVQSHQQTENLLRKRAVQPAPSGTPGSSQGTAGTSGTSGTGTTGSTGVTGPSSEASAVDTYAAMTLPDVQQHLQMAKELEKRVKSGGKYNKGER